MQANAVGKKSRAAAVIGDALAYIALTFSVGLAVSLAMAAVVLLLARQAQAANSELGPLTPAQAQQGTLLFKSDAGDTLAAPLLHTDAVIRISGMTARATVKQTFRNPSADWFEGIYVFPLPEHAAVDHLQMRIGERVVEGVIKEREAAKQSYERAKRSGQRAALLEQERPNMFTSSVANIGPNDEIVVEIEYQQTLHYEAGNDGGEYRLRFPMVVGPRYIPGTSAVAGAAGSGWAVDTDRVPDASRITPAVLRPSAHRQPINPVSLRVELDAGVPLASVSSTYHAVRMEQTEPAKRVIELAEGTTPADKDFELVWAPAAGSAPQAAWFAERKGSRTYGLLMVMPPALRDAQAKLPREVIFVIDTSGSMHGASIAQATQALELALSRLGEQDRFNIVEFNSVAHKLFADAVPANASFRAAAQRFVRGLQANGGTEMAQALDLALDGGDDAQRVRQVIFLTDGAVGNEDELFRLIGRKLGDSRLFTVGIGAAPNSHFMTRAARVGRGSFTYIGRVEEVKEKMDALFTKLESPVLKGLQAEWPAGSKAEVWPQRLPDLYAGEPVVLSVALDDADGIVRLSGMRGALPWQASVPLARETQSSGVGVLWARDKIGALAASLHEGAAEDEVRSAIVALALEHHLVTRYTSLVAIDRTPVRPAAAPLNTAAMPTSMPAGWTYEKVFGELPQGATSARFNLLVGLVALMLAASLFVPLPRLRGRAGVGARNCIPRHQQ